MILDISGDMKYELSSHLIYCLILLSLLCNSSKSCANKRSYKIVSIKINFGQIFILMKSFPEDESLKCEGNMNLLTNIFRRWHFDNR